MENESLISVEQLNTTLGYSLEKDESEACLQQAKF